MGKRRAWVITCDNPGCTEEYGRGHEADSRIAWQRAEGDHWRMKRVGKDLLELCPDCKNLYD